MSDDCSPKRLPCRVRSTFEIAVPLTELPPDRDSVLVSPTTVNELLANATCEEGTSMDMVAIYIPPKAKKPINNNNNNKKEEIPKIPEETTDNELSNQMQKVSLQSPNSTINALVAAPPSMGALMGAPSAIGAMVVAALQPSSPEAVDGQLGKDFQLIHNEYKQAMAIEQPNDAHF